MRGAQLQFRFRERSNYLKRKGSLSHGLSNGPDESMTGMSGKKKYRRQQSESIILPTRFLLGGNIADPLNLASFSNPDSGPQHTPISSPLPTPRHKKETIDVLIPVNMQDPLNLTDSGVSDGPTGSKSAASSAIVPLTPLKHKAGNKRNKKHNRRKRTDSECTTTGPLDEEVDAAGPGDKVSCKANAEAVSTNAKTTDLLDKVSDATTPAAASTNTPSLTLTATQSVPPPPPGLVSADQRLTCNNLTADWKRAERERIVSPALPQGPPLSRRQCEIFGLRKKKNNHTNNRSNNRNGRQENQGQESGVQEKRYRDKDRRFRYGNYDRYYGYRNQSHVPDSRIASLDPQWFRGKEVLDVGCNAGTVTIAVAQNFGPKSVIGIDIDSDLIREARLNVRKAIAKDPGVRFPLSLTTCRPPLVPTAATASIPFASLTCSPSSPSSQSPTATSSEEPVPAFPNNIFFAAANYVLDSDEQVESVVPEYDTILCLSVTKWIHLNWGDEGLKRTFRRMFRHLRPGGRLILEPQSWTSYVNKHSVCPETDANFRSIRFRPEKFCEFLTSEEVGFASCHLIATPHHQAKGFRRPIYCLTKTPASKD